MKNSIIAALLLSFTALISTAAMGQQNQGYLVDPKTGKPPVMTKNGKAAESNKKSDDKNATMPSKEERQKAFNEKHRGQKGKMPEDVQQKLERKEETKRYEQHEGKEEDQSGYKSDNSPKNGQVTGKERAAEVHARNEARRAEAQDKVAQGKKDIPDARKKIDDAKAQLEKAKKAKRVTTEQASEKEAKIKRAEEELGKLEKSVNATEATLKQ
ncbi:MAG: hypothetical protein IPL65_10070 [Lewinellaceae bacterium]|nr:hypothetical protein [Lewinellaceae bacterium]